MFWKRGVSYSVNKGDGQFYSIWGGGLVTGKGRGRGHQKRSDR